MPEVAFPDLLHLPRYTPGDHSLAHIEVPIVLSANENPYGPSPKVVETIQQYAHTVNRYPPDSAPLKRKLIEQYQLHDLKGEIVIGAGSDELITLLARGFAAPQSTVLMSEHGFLMYPIAAQSVGAVPRKVAEKNYCTDPEAILAACDDSTRLIYLANPNNPTGSYLNTTEIRSLVKRLPEHVLLVLDGAYSECVEADDYSDHHDLVETGRVAIIHTFSKMYGLAALRVGWGFMPAEVADILERLRSPFNMTTLSLKAAEAALDDQDYLRWCQEQNTRQRQRLVQTLHQLGLEVLPSVANFVLVKLDSAAQSTQLENDLKQYGIITRHMRGYGLAECLRISIGTEDDNSALINAMQKILL